MRILAAICFLALTMGWSACNTGDARNQQAVAEKEKSKYVGDELSVQHGMSIFNEHCASCHSFEEAGIGPNLSGVTSAMDKDWLVKFITNPPAVIESGDARAVDLFKRFNQYMPPFPNFSEEEMEHLLGFIHKFSEGEKKSINNRPGGILNPVVPKITTSDLTLVIEPWLTIPASAEKSPLARINKMLSLPAKKGERLFVHDLRGTLYELVAGQPQIYLNLKEKQPNFIDNPGYGTGFGSFAFHPEFEKNGLLYTTHTEGKRTAPADFAIEDSIRTVLQWVLTEWTLADPAATTFDGTHREILRADMYSNVHGFQELTFNPLSKPGNPDYGMLYLSVGDGGAALSNYTFLCDSKSRIWGSVIRIDPLGKNSSNGKYGIPKDNPFVSEAGALGEIWARGFRNPHIITWDRTGSGKMFITNIGQHSIEEVNLGMAGADYGWPHREGTYLFDVKANPELVYPLPADDQGYTYPVLQYDHDEGNAVCGGFVYAGKKIPLLKGKYLFGDIPRGHLFFGEVQDMEPGKQGTVYRMQLEYQGKPAKLEEVTQNQRVDLRFGMDSAGEMYLLTKSNGMIYKVVDCKKAAL